MRVKIKLKAKELKHIKKINIEEGYLRASVKADIKIIRDAQKKVLASLLLFISLAFTPQIQILPNSDSITVIEDALLESIYPESEFVYVSE